MDPAVGFSSPDLTPRRWRPNPDPLSLAAMSPLEKPRSWRRLGGLEVLPSLSGVET